MLNVTIRNGVINDKGEVINGENEEINGEINDEINGKLNPALLCLSKSELAVNNLIEEAPQHSRQEIADRLSISTRTVDRAISSLVKKNLIIREGSRKNGYWKINK